MEKFPNIQKINFQTELFEQIIPRKEFYSQANLDSTMWNILYLYTYVSNKYLLCIILHTENKYI